MVKIIYPASDAVFYITTRQPKTDAEWGELQGKTLALAESANLLMMPGRARDQDRWMQDAKLMLDAGRAAYRAARSKDLAALEALSDQLYESCTSCHQHYRPNYGRRPAPAASAPAAICRTCPTCPSRPTCPTRPTGLDHRGRWKLRAAEDVRADGTVARYPWGQHPVGSIVVEGGVVLPADHVERHAAFPAGSTAPGEQMKAALLSSYIAYSGPCTINEPEGSVTLKVEAAWRPDYVGTEQKRYLQVRERHAAVRPGSRIDPRRQRDADAAADAGPRAVSDDAVIGRSRPDVRLRPVTFFRVACVIFSCHLAPRRIPVIA